mmetsp:Transcript_13070/g.33052  ORF Transcript_13070/g.33052 Transcript_13070/m.33052 type:complete len:222 (-) Transcript_13070:87-752(-)
MMSPSAEKASLVTREAPPAPLASALVSTVHPGAPKITWPPPPSQPTCLILRPRNTSHASILALFGARITRYPLAQASEASLYPFRTLVTTKLTASRMRMRPRLSVHATRRWSGLATIERTSRLGSKKGTAEAPRAVRRMTPSLSSSSSAEPGLAAPPEPLNFLRRRPTRGRASSAAESSDTFSSFISTCIETSVGALPPISTLTLPPPLPPPSPPTSSLAR